MIINDFFLKYPNLLELDISYYEIINPYDHDNNNFIFTTCHKLIHEFIELVEKQNHLYYENEKSFIEFEDDNDFISIHYCATECGELIKKDNIEDLFDELCYCAFKEIGNRDCMSISLNDEIFLREFLKKLKKI